MLLIWNSNIHRMKKRKRTRANSGSV